MPLTLSVSVYSVSAISLVGIDGHITVFSALKGLAVLLHVPIQLNVKITQAISTGQIYTCSCSGALHY